PPAFRGREKVAWSGGRADLPCQFLAENARIAGIGEPGFEIDHAIPDQLCDFTVEMLHTFGGACLDGVEKTFVLALAFFNALASARICLEDFEGGNAAAAIRPRQEPLADNVAKRFGKPLAHRLLLRRRKRTDDALERLGGVHCVQTGQDEVSGLSR